MKSHKGPSFPPGPLADAYAKMHLIYVETSRHRQAVDAIKRLFRAAGTSGTHKGLALIGPSGVGKTATVKYIER